MPQTVRGGCLAVFGVDPEGCVAHLRQRRPASSEWSGWEELSTIGLHGVTACLNVEERCEAFAIGADGTLQHSWQLDTSGHVAWGAWQQLGPIGCGEPTVAQNLDGHLELFAVGPDGRLGHAWRVAPRGHGGWSVWTPMGPRVKGRIAVGANADGHLELSATGEDGQLGHLWQTKPHGWSAFESFGPPITSDPVVYPNVAGHLELFARGPEGLLGHLYQPVPNGVHGWTQWSDFGPEIIGTPAVGANINGQLIVFARAADGRLGHIWQLEPNARTGWSEWEPLGPELAGDPVVGRGADGRLHVFAVTVDGQLGHAWHHRPDGATAWSDWEVLAECNPSVRLSVCLMQDRGELPPPSMVARSGAPAARLRADYCVIGGGPAGLTVADRLARAGATVILVESGAVGENPLTHALSRGIATGEIVKDDWQYLRVGRRRQVGGSTTGWGRGWCMPFRDIDFAERDWVERSGWPMTRAEFARYEHRAVETFGFEPFDKPISKGGLEWLAYHYPPDRKLFETMFLELGSVPEFHAELGATAVDFNVNDGAIESVRCANLRGEEVEVAADTFVLAGGAVENARQLLLLEAELPGLSPLTGRCFMEHPHVLAGSMHVPDATGLESFLLDPELMTERDALDVLALDAARQEAGGILSGSVQLRPHHHGDISSGPTDCDLYVRTEQAPNPDSRVTLGRRTDYFGRPRARLEWKLLEQDWNTVMTTTIEIATVLEHLYGGIVNLRIRANDPWPWKAAGPAASRNATWGYHQMGTTRMADSADRGVVDYNGLAYGTANLYLAGASVFPTGSCANPTFMIVALSHRLAEHLLDAG